MATRSEAILEKFPRGTTPPFCPKMPGYYCMVNPEKCGRSNRKIIMSGCRNLLFISVLSRIQKIGNSKAKRKKAANNKINVVDIPAPVVEPVPADKVFKDELPPIEPEPPPIPPPTHCRSCSAELERLPWNTRCDLLICTNFGCHLYHTPQWRILIKRESQAETVSEALLKEENGQDR